jgi:hypothetical protein
LKTQFSFNTGWRRLGEYRYLQGEKLVEIPFVLEGKIVTSNRSAEAHEVHACCFSSGKSYHNDRRGFVVFAQFYVGTKEEIGNASEKAEKVHIANLVN